LLDGCGECKDCRVVHHQLHGFLSLGSTGADSKD